MANFVVERKSPQELTQEDIETLVKWTTDAGWDPHVRPSDISHMYGGPPYLNAKIFFGFLDGKRIGHVALITVGNSTDVMEYITMFIMDKPLRGKGYGLKIWNAMWECRDTSANTYLDAVTKMSSNYESMGLNIVEWDNREYIIPLSAIAVKYKMTERIGNVLTKPLSEVELDKIVEYDAMVYGIRRPVLIKKWTAVPESFTWVGVNEKGDVVGCITIREGADKQDAIVGPLFSDNLEIAKKLMYIAAQTMSSQTSSKNLRILMCVQTRESNAIQMIESDFGVKCCANFLRMCSKKSKVDISKIISIHSLGYG
ncbi:holothin acyltransferase-like [Dysidea avara]|uniref:holothin acyltransferase-like n=1 Tax=Dysidea avara TaxID=196820 RepID=UPI00331EDA1D